MPNLRPIRQLPRFETRFDWVQLVETMKAANVTDLFDEERADLGNISDDKLYVSKVHKVFILLVIPFPAGFC
jgi:serine protease inhibitor